MRVVLEPITKVTLNLYSRDVGWFKLRFPQGYTEEIREAIRRHILYIESMEYTGNMKDE
jgi:hypothetical protein